MVSALWASQRANTSTSIYGVEMYYSQQPWHEAYGNLGCDLCLEDSEKQITDKRLTCQFERERKSTTEHPSTQLTSFHKVPLKSDFRHQDTHRPLLQQWSR